MPVSVVDIKTDSDVPRRNNPFSGAMRYERALCDGSKGSEAEASDHLVLDPGRLQLVRSDSGTDY